MQARKKSDHDESAHDVRPTVDETEVHHVLAAETDGRSWQRALPAARMVWQRAHAFVPRVAFLDPFVRDRVFVGRDGWEGDGRGFGVFGRGDVEVDERLGDPVGGRGGAAAAFRGGFGRGLGWGIWGGGGA
jgi:hypothetical protein